MVFFREEGGGGRPPISSRRHGWSSEGLEKIKNTQTKLLKSCLLQTLRDPRHPEMSGQRVSREGIRRVITQIGRNNNHIFSSF